MIRPVSYCLYLFPWLFYSCKLPRHFKKGLAVPLTLIPAYCVLQAVTIRTYLSLKQLLDLSVTLRVTGPAHICLKAVTVPVYQSGSYWSSLFLQAVTAPICHSFTEGVTAPIFHSSSNYPYHSPRQLLPFTCALAVTAPTLFYNWESYCPYIHLSLRI